MQGDGEALRSDIVLGLVKRSDMGHSKPSGLPIPLGESLEVARVGHHTAPRQNTALVFTRSQLPQGDQSELV